jgi:glycosyltransferase involved in cell wall biosynthesis
MMRAMSSNRPDISIVLTGHRERCIVGPTLRSCADAIAFARANHGLNVECVIVLDRTDQVTRQMMQTDVLPVSSVIETDFGDPGQARNAGVAVARGECLTFLDADDLWSYNWLAEAWIFCAKRPDAVAHSEVNVVFGLERNIWWHIDSEGPLYDPLYLRWANYWDAMSFARADIYRLFPFKPNDLQLGFGHEDWHWNCKTIDAGIAHKPVHSTVHFKRRRASSQMARVAQTGSIVWPSEIESSPFSATG